MLATSLSSVVKLAVKLNLRCLIVVEKNGNTFIFHLNLADSQNKFKITFVTHCAYVYKIYKAILDETMIFVSRGVTRRFR